MYIRAKGACGVKGALLCSLHCSYIFLQPTAQPNAPVKQLVFMHKFQSINANTYGMVAIYACHCLGNYVNLRQNHAFCLSTGVPRHSAVGIGTFVRLYIRTYIRMWYISFAMSMCK